MANNTKTETNKAGDSGEKEVQAAADEATQKGYYGEATDERPNEDYTLQGVVKARK